MPNEAFEQFRKLVLSDSALRDELIPILDRGEFIDRVVELGRLHSLEFDREDVVQAMRGSRSSLGAKWK